MQQNQFKDRLKLPKPEILPHKFRVDELRSRGNYLAAAEMLFLGLLKCESA